MIQAKRDKKCRACGNWFRASNTLHRACSPPCAIEVARQDEAKAQRKEQKRRRQEVKPLTRLCSEAQTEVNRYIRDRDRDRLCISCGKRPITDAGHFFHAGSKYRTSRLRFDERVIHGQCGHCNRYSGGGNIEAYRQGIIDRYGQQYLDTLYEIKDQADRGELEPLTKDEVRQIAADHRRAVRDMQKVES